MADDVKTVPSQEGAAAAAAAAPVSTQTEPIAEPSPASGESGFAPTLLEKFDAAEEKAPEAAPTPTETPAPAEAAPADAPKVEEPKADGEPPKTEEAKPAEAAPVEPVKLDPIDYKYQAPEGFEITDERKGEIAAALDTFRANPAEGAQALLDLHAKAMTELGEKIRTDQTEVFNNTKADWEKAVLADPVIGGAGHDTAMRAIARARDFALNSVPTSQRDSFRQDFEHFLRVTGAGSHPAFLKFAHAFDALLEPQSAAIPTGILPPNDIGKAPPGAKRAGNGLYDHPRGEAQN